MCQVKKEAGYSPAEEAAEVQDNHFSFHVYMLIKKSTNQSKRFMVTFANGKVVHFGQAGGSTYIDHNDKAKRAAYLARHAANEDWSNPYSAGSLSRWLLWGKHKTLEANHESFMKKFPNV